MLCVHQQFHFSNPQEKVLAMNLGVMKPHIDDNANCVPMFNLYEFWRILLVNQPMKNPYNSILFNLESHFGETYPNQESSVSNVPLSVGIHNSSQTKIDVPSLIFKRILEP